MPLCSQGSMRRVRAGTDRPMGRSIASGGDPKVSKGERREARAQWAQPPQAVSDPEFRPTTSGAHGSAGRADCLPRGKPPCLRQQEITLPKKLPLVGNDAPTPAREKGLQPYGALYRFGWRSEGDWGRAESPLLASTRDNFAVSNSPWWGLTRRLRRGRRACSPMGRSHFSFGGERKVCKRKPAARRLQRRPAPLRVAGFVLR